MQQNLFIQSMVGYRNKHQIYVYACKSGTRANNELGRKKEQAARMDAANRTSWYQRTAENYTRKQGTESDRQNTEMQ